MMSIKNILLCLMVLGASACAEVAKIDQVIDNVATAQQGLGISQSSSSLTWKTTKPIVKQLDAGQILSIIDQPLVLTSRLGQKPAQLMFKSLGAPGLYAAEWSGGFTRSNRAAVEGNRICEVSMGPDGLAKTCYTVFEDKNGLLKFVFTGRDETTGKENLYSFLVTEPEGF